MNKIKFILCLFICPYLSAQISIQVPTNNSSISIPKSIKGVNKTANGLNSWSNNNSFQTEYQKLNIGINRFPGGTFANSYDWKKELSNTSKFNFKRAIEFSKANKEEINYMLNFGTTTSHEAAELVRICNYHTPYYQNLRLQMFGDTSAVNIKKWELGNELAAKWVWHVSWLGGGYNTYIKYQTGIDSLYIPRSLSDSLHYFGGSLWRKGWVTNIGNDGMTNLNAILGSTHIVNANDGDSVLVEIEFGPIYQDSVIVWACTTQVTPQMIDTLTQQEIYDLSTQASFLLDTNQYHLLGDSSVMVYPNTPLDTNMFILVEYKTKHPGAFEIRDSMMQADPTIEIGYCVDFRTFLLGNATFENRLSNSPPRFLIYHPYNEGTDLALNSAFYSEIVYLAEKNKNKFADTQHSLDSISTSLGIFPAIGIGLTEWNIRLCGDGGCHPSYNGILGGLYTANFYTQFYDAYIKNEVDLRLNNHFALIATGYNLIHMFHYNDATNSVISTPQSEATRIINNAIKDNLIIEDSSTINGMPQIPILVKNNAGSYDTVLTNPVHIYKSIDTVNQTINYLLLNQDDANNYNIDFSIAPEWQADSVYTESLSGVMDTSIYYVDQDTLFVSNNSISISIDSFSLKSIKIHYNNLPASLYQLSINTQIQFEIYPNPTKGSIHVLNLNNQEYKLAVYATTGELVDNKKTCIDRNIEYSFRNFKPGTYYLKIITAEHSYLKKVIIY